MPCLELPSIPYPPGLDLILPSLDIEVGIPPVGIDLCCKISIIPPIPVIALGSIPSVAIILYPVIATITTVIDQLNDLLDQIQIECPLD